MKKYILKSLFVSMLCMLAASCQDTDEFAQLDSRKAQVMFSVAMDSPSARSRANWDEGQYTPSELGNAYDNHIDLNQFVVKIEAGGKNYELKDIIKWKVEAENKDEVSNEYKFVGVVEGVNKQTELEEVKISVFANMGSNAENLTFNQDAKNIPMWGVHSKDKLVLKPGVRQDVGAIYLLRAMAKIEVSISDDMVADGYSLNSVKLKKYNFKGNSLLENYSTYANTSAIDTETKNVNASDSRENLAFTPAEAGKKYIVYLPEVDNAEGEDKELKLILTLQKEGEEYIETELVVKDYTGNTGLIDIVRNHWYKYVISGIVNGNPTVEYSVVPWTGVDIEVGGEKFLVLNKDVIEIYNSNIDADQLKFSSSSPIKSIVLKDIYKHERNGAFTEGAEDGVYAYYMDKFGTLTQVESALENEISAEVIGENKDILDGGISITSPFINHETFGPTHYDTPRYLEFEVENDQELTATFRVVQFPPVVITNEEGFFSYRDDFRRTDDEEPAHYLNYMGPGSISLIGMSLVHEHDWTDEPTTEDYLNTSVHFRDYNWLHQGTFPWLSEANAGKIDNNCPNQGKVGERWEEMRYATTSYSIQYDSLGHNVIQHYGGYYRAFKDQGDINGTSDILFSRDRYWNIGSGNAKTCYKGDAVGPAYEKYITKDGVSVKRTFRKHYSWNVQSIFWSRYVHGVFKEDGTNVNGRKRLKGHADICQLGDAAELPGYEPTDFAIYSRPRLYRNHRMYHIKTTVATSDAVLGYPTLVDENGVPTNNPDRGSTENTPSNANMISPYLVLASELGATDYNYILANCAYYGYVFPGLSDFYKFAERHCREYVETSYIDKNNSGSYEPEYDGEVKYYHDWRLPTKAEIEMIINYQTNSRAMDRVLLGEHFVCITGNPGKGDNEEYWVSSEVPGYKISAKEDLDGIATDYSGYYIRCVRDVKPVNK